MDLSKKNQVNKKMNNLIKKNEFLDGWKSIEHKKTFDVWNKMSKSYFKYIFSSFEENKYLLKYLSQKKKSSILDYGCSSGYLKRFLNLNFGEKFDYTGYDISEQSIKLAKQLYGNDYFLDEDDYKLNNTFKNKKFDLVYSRDTVLHQKDPWKFICELVSKVKKTIILRLRTRNHGNTILDIEKSCQLVSGEKWVPYIVLNYQELIQFLQKFNFKFIMTNRSKTILGGKNNRYLDKSLYYKNTEGAETSIIASYDEDIEKEKLIETHSLEGHDFLKKNYFKTTFFKILNRLNI